LSRRCATDRLSWTDRRLRPNRRRSVKSSRCNVADRLRRRRGRGIDLCLALRTARSIDEPAERSQSETEGQGGGGTDNETNSGLCVCVCVCASLSAYCCVGACSAASNRPTTSGHLYPRLNMQTSGCMTTACRCVDDDLRLLRTTLSFKASDSSCRDDNRQ